MKPTRKPTAARVRTKKRTVSMWLALYGDDCVIAGPHRPDVERRAHNVRLCGYRVGPIIRVEVPMAGGRKEKK